MDSTTPPKLPSKDPVLPDKPKCVDSDLQSQQGQQAMPTICVEDQEPVSQSDDGSMLYFNGCPVPAADFDTQNRPVTPVDPGPVQADPAPNSSSTSTLPVITLEINKVVYSITKANISISTVEDGSASVNLSLEVGATTDPNAVIVRRDNKSIKTSFKASGRALYGAATKLFKSHKSNDPQSTSSSIRVNSEPAPTEDSGAAGAADIDQVDATGTDASGGHSCDPELSKRATSSSRDNTVESDNAQSLQQQVSTTEETSGASSKTKTLKNIFGRKAKPSDGDPSLPSKGQKGQEDSKPTPAVVQFPDNMSDKLKAFFQVTPDNKLIATVYAADTTSFSEDIKEIKKTLVGDPLKRKVKVKGKSRPVWLNPTVGEKVEIWKFYYDLDNRCTMALGRLPGTDLYGYVLPKEIDREKQFDTAEEQAAYNKAISSLPFDQDDVYEMDEPVAQAESAAVEEEVGEVYM